MLHVQERVLYPSIDCNEPSLCQSFLVRQSTKISGRKNQQKRTFTKQSLLNYKSRFVDMEWAAVYRCAKERHNARCDGWFQKTIWGKIRTTGIH